LTSADQGRRLIVVVNARNAAGGGSAQSAPTSTIGPRAARPANSSPPTISGTPQEGQALTASPGSWSGTQPITFAYQWRRCDRNGGSCAAIANATGQAYTLTSAEIGQTVRVRVTARNSVGARSSTSVPSAVITRAAPPGPEGQIRLPNGKISIPITSVDLPARLVIDQVRFSPNPVTSRRGAITARFRVADTRGFVVRDVLVFALGVPYNRIQNVSEQAAGTDGWVNLTLQPTAKLPLRNGFFLTVFVRARKSGDNLLAGVSARRLVQVRLGAPS
jgi:hypothetical protein